MSTPKSPSVAQKKKRLVQLRDAQRRRRERLREDKQHFVQIILPENILSQLNGIIAATGETMQQAIARLVQASLPGEASENRAAPAAIPDYNRDLETEGEVFAVAALTEDTSFEPIKAELLLADPKSEKADTHQEPNLSRAGQMDLFG